MFAVSSPPSWRSFLPTSAAAGAFGIVPRAYPKLIHFNEVDKGRHFAAWEQPELFSVELRAAFRPLR